ncbi:MAG TPA: hypothetical protein VKY41_05085 [Xanthomarina sp.]|nr:hypothetical protein [Xanthomarina sp.]
MKKILLFAAFAVFAFTTVQSQNMKAGASIALPVGDAGDASSIGAQLDFAYFFDINEAFKVGPMASFFFYNGKDYDYPGGKIKGESFLFLPIGGSARYIIEDFFFGADLGYGIGLSPDGNDGGFFFRPKAGYNFGSLAAILSYSGISRKYTAAVGPGYSVSSTSTFGSINAGVEFSF